VLDFLITGIARSGTTVLADSLTIIPTVYCGQERFSFSSYVSPEFAKFGQKTWCDRNICGNFEDIGRFQEKVKAGVQIEALGDKQPELICFSDIQTKSDIPVIFLYRDLKSVCRSWDERAANIKDYAWPREKTGIHVFTELLIFLGTWEHQKVNFLSYNNLGAVSAEHEWLFLLELLNVDSFWMSNIKKGFLNRRDVWEFEQDRYLEISHAMDLPSFECEYANLKAINRRELVSDFADHIALSFEEIYEIYASRMTSSETQYLSIYESLLIEGSAGYITRKMSDPENNFKAFLKTCFATKKKG
jgi:hypothetical protein